MNESDLTQELMKYCRELMPRAKVLKHAEKFIGGRPDVSTTWVHITCWWEIKFYDDRSFDSPPKQKDTCQELERNGVCHYIIYERRGEVRRTLIVRPRDIDDWQNQWVAAAPGFNHGWAAYWIRCTHLLNANPTSSVNV